jgi:hypothetical protein
LKLLRNVSATSLLHPPDQRECQPIASAFENGRARRPPRRAAPWLLLWAAGQLKQQSRRRRWCGDNAEARVAQRRRLRSFRGGRDESGGGDGSSCGRAVVACWCEPPAFRASSLLAVVASLPCTRSMHVRVRPIVAAFDWAGVLAGTEDTAALGACVLARRRRPANGAELRRPRRRTRYWRREAGSCPRSGRVSLPL